MRKKQQSDTSKHRVRNSPKSSKSYFFCCRKWLTKGTPIRDLKKVAKATFSVAEIIENKSAFMRFKKSIKS